MQTCIDMFFIKNYNNSNKVYTRIHCVSFCPHVHFFVVMFSIKNNVIFIVPVMSPCRYRWRHSAMLWVEIDLRRESSKVWCEEGLDALKTLKGLIIRSFLKGPYT